MTLTQAKKLIIRTGRLLYDKGFIAAYDGNLSIRLDNKTILITPSMRAKGFLNESELVKIDYDGRKLSGGGKPSSEMYMHLTVYLSRSEIYACCHAHPPYATAFAAAGKKLPENILPEVIITAGEIPLVKYIPTGEPREWKKFKKYINRHDAFLLANHGVLTLGQTIEKAFFRMEMVEHYARIAYIASNMGRLNRLDVSEVRRLQKIREKLR
jgi:L-fuculose-phosphate aldolase